MGSDTQANALAATVAKPAGRTYVLLLLTLVYTFNHIDRQILVILLEPIKADLKLDDVIPEPPAPSAAPPAPQPGAPAPAPDLSLAEAPPAGPQRPGFLAGSLPGNLLAGLAGGVLAFAFSLAAASLVFSPGLLPVYLTHGLTMALFCSVAVGAVCALRSELGFALAGTDRKSVV